MIESLKILEKIDDIQIIKVVIPSKNNFNGCLYKASPKVKLTKGDKVVVPYGDLFSFEVGIVQDVDAKSELDYNADYSYRWITQKVDEDSYVSMLEQEQEIISDVS